MRAKDLLVLMLTPAVLEASIAVLPVRWRLQRLEQVMAVHLEAQHRLHVPSTVLDRAVLANRQPVDLLEPTLQLVVEHTR